jgi:hypothetical protein
MKTTTFTRRKDRMTTTGFLHRTECKGTPVAVHVLPNGDVECLVHSADGGSAPLARLTVARETFEGMEAVRDGVLRLGDTWTLILGSRARMQKFLDAVSAA